MTQLCWEECEEDAAEKTMTKLGLSEKSMNAMHFYGTTNLNN